MASEVSGGAQLACNWLSLGTDVALGDLLEIMVESITGSLASISMDELRNKAVTVVACPDDRWRRECCGSKSTRG